MRLTPAASERHLESMYKGWPDKVVYKGKPIDGFVERELEPEFSEGDSGEGETSLVLHTAVVIPLNSLVSWNGTEFKIRKREEDNGAWSYWLQEN